MRITLLSLLMVFALVGGSQDTKPDENQGTAETLKNRLADIETKIGKLAGTTWRADNSVETLNSHIEALKGQLESMKSKIALLDQHVYFLATFESLTLNVQPGTVVFDKVLANTGNAYNASSGMFTAPRAGLYAFTVQAFNKNGTRLEWDLHVNGKIVLRNKSFTKETNNNYIYPVTLKSGDTVSVYNILLVNIWGTTHSVMAGWLIKAL